MRTTYLLLTAIAFVVFPAASAATGEPLPETDYRATILVRDFECPDDAPELGRVAAEAVAAALEKGGLAIVVRPEYVVRDVVDVTAPAIEVKDVPTGVDRQDERRTDVFVSPRWRHDRRELSAPESDFVVEGAAGMVGESWWLRAVTRDRVSNEILLEGASSQAEGEKGLFVAAERIAPQIETAFRTVVLERRSEAVRRAVASDQMDRAVALGRLRDMNAHWPAELAPAVVAFLIVSEDKAGDPASEAEWKAKVVSLIPKAGPAGDRLLMRLGLDPRGFRPAPEAPPSGPVTR